VNRAASTPRALLIIVGVLAAAAGCAPNATSRDDTARQDEAQRAPRQPDFVAATPESLVARARVDVPAGRRVLIPLDPKVGNQLASLSFGDSRVNAWLDRGDIRAAQPIDARILRVVRRPTSSIDGPAANANTWLADPGIWSSLTVDQVRTAPADGVWVLVIDPISLADSRATSSDTTDITDTNAPIDATDAATILRVGPSADAAIIDFTINPIPARERLIRTAGPESPWRPVLADAERTDSAVISAISPEARSPLTRWRYRLLTDGLDPAADPAANPAARASAFADPFADPAIEVLAQQNEDRWRVALAWLWFANPDVAHRLKSRVAAVARFASPNVTGQSAARGRLAPLWPLDHADLDTLLSELLEPRIDAGQRVVLAERWLARQPGAAAWIHDDGGVLAFTNGDPVVVATVGVINLLDRPTLAWTTLTPNEPTPDLVPVASMSGVLLSRPIAHSTDRRHAGPTPSGTRVLTAHLGQIAAPLQVSSRPFPVTPPGAALGPYLPDWTMADFLSAAPGAIDGAWATAALVHKSVAPDRADAWEVFVECRVPTESSLAARQPTFDPSRESATFFLGPSGAPGAVVRVSRDGTVAANGPLADTFPKLVEVIRADDRWSFRLRLDPRVIEEGGVLRLGLMRTDALGQRWSYPRSMLPWELEPARVALDLDAWNR
jgi:hypothetical protein